MQIRHVNSADIDAIVDLYNDYINTTTITFEEEAISAPILQERIEKVRQANLPWLVVENEGQVQGYAYASQWHTRSAYRFTVESSIYLAKTAVGKGMGKALYQQLLDEVKHQGMKNVMGVIALPNAPSVAMHESLGFQKVGEHSRVGFKFERWISVGYWQLEL